MKTIKISENNFNDLKINLHGVLRDESNNLVKVSPRQVGQFVKLINGDEFLIGSISQNVPPHINIVEPYDMARNEEQKQNLIEIGKDFKRSLIVDTTTEANPEEFPFILYTSRY